jgi:two-component system response regulator QseB
MRILLAEENDLDAEHTVSSLRRQGYAVDRVREGTQAQLALMTTQYALVLMNMTLRRLSASCLLSWLRGFSHRVPVLAFKDDDSVADCVDALNAGADDYVSKPFDPRELAARCRALLRRSQGRHADRMQWCGVLVDPVAQTVLANGKPVTTSPREWALLLQLITHPDVPQSASTLEDCIYGWKEEIQSNAIQVHISNLRKKLGPDTIQTVRGIGYVINSKR